MIDRVKPVFEKILRKQAGRTIMVVVPDALLNIMLRLAVHADCSFDRVGKLNEGNRLAIDPELTREIQSHDPASQLA